MRLIRTPPSPPAFNLALDEALLRSGTPTLRLYSWDPPGFSIGFFQQHDSLHPPAGFEVVRRPTGGGAIAHVGELTVSWVGRKRRVDDVYADMNAIVAHALEHSFGLGWGYGEGQPEAAPPGLCFDAHTCYDLLAGERKIFGSAQRRGGDRFLLHGSFVVAQNPAAIGAVSLEELLGRVVPLDEVEHAVMNAAAERWGVVFEEQEPTAEELADADRLVRERYANEQWTRRR